MVVTEPFFKMFYVYYLIDPRSLKVFYVGKGSGDRVNFHEREVQRGRSTGNPHKDRKISQILEAGHSVMTHIVFETSDENEAYVKEEELQYQIGLADLTNICIGSRPPRLVITEERREMMRSAMVGNTINNGRTRSTDAKTKTGLSLRRAYESGDRVVSEKMRETSSRTHKGKSVSETTRAKISASRKGKSLEELWGTEKAFIARQKSSEIAKNGIAARAKLELTGKTYEEIHGIERAQEIKNKQGAWSREHRGTKIVYDGVEYRSIKEASDATGISRYLIKKNANK